MFRICRGVQEHRVIKNIELIIQIQKRNQIII